MIKYQALGLFGPHKLEREPCSAPDRLVVRRQIGRDPRGMIGVVARCSLGLPAVALVQASVGPNQEPFPTALWLVCPLLKKLVARLEAAGNIKLWEATLAETPALMKAYIQAHQQYRALQAELGGLQIGIAGIRDQQFVKCLHAHTAHFVAGGDNLIGAWVLEQVALPACCSYQSTRCQADSGQN